MPGDRDDQSLRQQAQRLEEKLAPDNMGAALVAAGAILTGYELVKTSILEGPESFFSFDWDPKTGKPIPGPDYVREVLDRGTNRWTGSCAWLVYMNALTDERVQELESIRDHRADIAHELARLLVDPDADVDLSMLARLRGIMRELDRFWGGIEVDISPDFDGQRDGIDYDDIRSGSGLILEYLCTLAGLE